MKRNLLKHEHLKMLRKVPYRIFLILISIAIGTAGFSQQISASLLCSGGETFVTTNQSIEFAIGEIATETYQLGSTAISQGFFQGAPEGTDMNEDFLKEVNIRIFPNPTKGFLTVSCEKTPAYIEVIDLHGQLVFTIQKPNKSEVLNIENLQSGIYLLRLIFEGNIPTTKRIVKN